jgi:putative ABC transport system permease protein
MLGGVRPLDGRLFGATDGGPGQADVVLVSEALWRSLYDSDPGLVGRSVTVDGERLRVIGILPNEFRCPRATAMLWRPVALDNLSNVRSAYVRFAPEMPREEALRLAAGAVGAVHPQKGEVRAVASPLVQLREDYSNRALSLLTGAVVLVFVVLCANVCTLLLARLTARRREFSMRAALGARAAA